MTKYDYTPLSHDRLLKYLKYDPETGEWERVALTGRHVKGNKVGTENPNGYVYMSIGRKKYLSHRLAWFYMVGKWPNQIDHINGVRADNRWENLRECDPSQNRCNSVMRSDNTSGYRGVYWHKKSMKWAAYCRMKGKRYNLGYFDCKHEAAVTYNKKITELHGSFATVNRIQETQ